MSDYVEVRGNGAMQVLPLSATRFTIGRAVGNDLVLDDDQVSRLHTTLEQLGPGWVARDVGSRNGTWVNGRRISGDHRLGADDELRIGRTLLRLRSATVAGSETVAPDPIPDLTRRERDVLLALFRTSDRGEVFSEPASTRAVAAALHISEAAVKQHLGNLYTKFNIGTDETTSRRTSLANEALRRGAISLADVTRPDAS